MRDPAKLEPFAWYPWYPLRYRASRTVQRLRPAERGYYRDLLDEIFLRGSIANNPAELAEICDCSEAEMKRAWPRLSKCFYDREDGSLGNETMDVVAERQELRRRQQSERGKKSAAVRWGTPALAECQPAVDTPASVSPEAVTTVSDSVTTVNHGYENGNSAVTEHNQREEKRGEDKELNTCEVFSLSGESPLPPEAALEEAVKAGWEYFLAQTGKHPVQYRLTKPRLVQGRRGFESLVSFCKRCKWENPLSTAGELFRVAVDRLATSAFHNGQNHDGKKYLDWHQLFAGRGYPSPQKLLEVWLDDDRWPK